MKTKLIILLLCSVSSFAENKQEKRLLEQIAALKIYAGYAQKGITIARKGLTTINNIRKGDFNLHRDFISSFSNINPKIKNYAKVADIIALQVRIIKEMKEAMAGVKEAKQFTAAEIDYCSSVIDNLLNASLGNINELIDILTAGQLQMKDDERIKRIDALYTDMQDKYSFSSSFSEDMALLTVQRMRELRDVELSRILNGIK